MITTLAYSIATKSGDGDGLRELYSVWTAMIRQKK
jgi:hypothetical protein